MRGEGTGEQEGQIMMIKFLVNTKDIGEGRVLTARVHVYGTCVWTVKQLASVALQNLSAGKVSLTLAGSYALLVVAKCK